MIGIDTNVLVRFLTADDEHQYQRVVEFFRERTPSDPAFISAVTLAETIWLLRSRYGLRPAEIVDSVSQLLDSDDFVVEGRQAIETARAGGVKPAQLIDFLVAHMSLKAGCSRLVTFDMRAAKSVPGMELLS